jgi:hypothetical protein
MGALRRPLIGKAEEIRQHSQLDNSGIEAVTLVRELSNGYA